MLCTVLPKLLRARAYEGLSMASVDRIQIRGVIGALREREGTVWRGLERSWIERDSQNPT